MNNFHIVVAGHKDINAQKLDAPYYEVDRRSINKIEGIQSNLEVWSEYPAFFNSFPVAQEIEYFGLLHYRCMLNLSGEDKKIILPFNERYSFANKQLKFIEENKGSIIVGEPLSFNLFHLSAMNQLIACESDIKPLMKFASNEFKRITGVDAYDLLNKQTYLYSRNIFISPIDFAKKWYDISYEIAKNMDESGITSKADRWGGYVLERLFSIYVQQHSFIEKPFIYFEEK